MAIQHEKGRFALKNALSAMAESAASFAKPLLVAAPLIGTALFLASGTQAQTSASTTPPNSGRRHCNSRAKARTCCAN